MKKLSSLVLALPVLALLVLVAAPVLAQPAVDLPRLGCIRDSQSQLRIVYGVRASFILSPPVALKVRAFFCSETIIAAQTPDALVAFDQSGAEIARVAVAEDAIVEFESDGKVLVADQLFIFDGKQWIEQEGGPPGPRRTPASGSAPKLGACTARLEQGKVALCEESLPDLPPVLSVERIGPGWLHLRTAEGSFALTLRNGKPETYALPATPPDAGEER
ncbi:MAG: hypothetical protein IT168_14470 [Bryobacterales bacterium]|nr:hypothetical protein [Bryobacterales bacterium]